MTSDIVYATMDNNNMQINDENTTPPSSSHSNRGKKKKTKKSHHNTSLGGKLLNGLKRGVTPPNRSKSSNTTSNVNDGGFPESSLPQESPSFANTTLPPGWQKAQDPSSGKTYYFNCNTNQTSWEIPQLTNNNTNPSASATTTKPKLERLPKVDHTKPEFQKLWKETLMNMTMDGDDNSTEVGNTLYEHMLKNNQLCCRSSREDYTKHINYQMKIQLNKIISENSEAKKTKLKWELVTGSYLDRNSKHSIFLGMANVPLIEYTVTEALVVMDFLLSYAEQQKEKSINQKHAWPIGSYNRPTVNGINDEDSEDDDEEEEEEEDKTITYLRLQKLYKCKSVLLALYFQHFIKSARANTLRATVPDNGFAYNGYHWSCNKNVSKCITVNRSGPIISVNRLNALVDTIVHGYHSTIINEEHFFFRRNGKKIHCGLSFIVDNTNANHLGCFASSRLECGKTANNCFGPSHVALSDTEINTFVSCLVIIM